MANKQIITEKDVLHVASLAKIYIPEAEIAPLTKELEAILEYVAKLQTLNVDGVEPTTHPLAITNVYREDKVVSLLTQEQALSIAVEKKNGFFKVPKVIE